MTENNIPYVIFGHPAPFGVVADGSTVCVVADGSDFCVVSSLSGVEVSGSFSVVFWVVGAAGVEVAGASVGFAVVVPSPTAADDTILETEISPTRTKTKVILLQTILLFGIVVSFFLFEFLTIKRLTIVNLVTLF